MGDMKDWVEDAAPLVDKQERHYDDAFSREIENNQLFKEILSELKTLNSYMEEITGDKL
jgi:hypothetical protein